MRVGAVYIAEAIDGETGRILQPGKHGDFRTVDGNFKYRSAALHIGIARGVHGHGHRRDTGDQRRLRIAACRDRRQLVHRARALIRNINVAGAIDGKRNRIAEAAGDRHLRLQSVGNQREPVDAFSGLIGHIDIAGHVQSNGLWSGCTTGWGVGDRGQTVGRGRARGGDLKFSDNRLPAGHREDVTGLVNRNLAGRCRQR